MDMLPDDNTMRKFLRDGLSNREIAKRYGVSPQAVNYRFTRMGIQRFPYISTATAILEAAYPTAPGFRRSDYTQRWRARQLFAFMRWRLGDPDLTERQIEAAKHFANRSRKHDVVLALAPDEPQPWVWVAREPSDGRRVLRWPAGREMPRGPHLAAITLPDEEEEESDAPAGAIVTLA